jgi:TM2 domain-containing membrane protein YozV
MTKYLLLFFLLILPAASAAVDLPSQLQFADSLAADNDHYRAITEYKRFLFLQPESELVPRARLSIATSLIAGKRWKQADASLEDLLSLYPQSPEAAKGRLLYANSAYERGEFGLARERYRTLAELQTDPETLDYANFRIGWTFLEQDRPQKARNSFSLLPRQEKEQLLEELEAYRKLPQKSPLIAGSLSAILPGAGQFYTGRWRQGILSFLLNGAFILGAIEAFDDEDYAVGGILLFFEIGWYGGNVYNALNNAYKYNERIKHDYKKQMRSRLNLQLGMLKKRPLIALSYRF